MSDKKNDPQVEEIELELSLEDYKKMFEDKRSELNDVREMLNKVEQEKNGLINRSLKVHAENELFKASPEIAKSKAKMIYQLEMAERFIKSGAFPKLTPEQAFVIIQAGQEMGMQPMESMNKLYCVNGGVDFYGAGMVSWITKNGYKIEYLNETPTSVDVRIYHENGFDKTESVTDQDQILKRSKAIGFAKKNKMRFHGVRAFRSFHLAHLFNSVVDGFTPAFNDWEEQQNNTSNTQVNFSDNNLLKEIQEAKELHELETIYNENKATIQRDINLMTAFGSAKKRFEDGK